MQVDARSRRADTRRRRLSGIMHQGTRATSDDTDPVMLAHTLCSLFDYACDVWTTELDVEWTG